MAEGVIKKKTRQITIFADLAKSGQSITANVEKYFDFNTEINNWIANHPGYSYQSMIFNGIYGIEGCMYSARTINSGTNRGKCAVISNKSGTIYVYVIVVMQKTE